MEREEHTDHCHRGESDARCQQSCGQARTLSDSFERGRAAERKRRPRRAGVASRPLRYVRTDRIMTAQSRART